MCLIIHKPAGITVPDYILDSARRKNNDGFGIMLNGQFEKWTNIKQSKLKHRINEKHRDAEIGIHFRMATHGDVNRKNAHPFPLCDGSALMHNGVIASYTPRTYKSEKSDTVCFIEQWVNPQIRKRGYLPVTDAEKEAGYSAFLHMSNDGHFTRFGDGWNKLDDVWLSNKYAFDYPYGNYAKTKMGEVEITESQYYDDDDEWWTNYEIGVNVKEYLAVYSDYLDLNDMMPHSSDSYSYDELLTGTITTAEFFEYAHPHTCLDAFMRLSRKERLPSPAFYK